METIRAVCENGMFRPLDPVELPEGASVAVSPVGQNWAQTIGESQGRAERTKKPLEGEEMVALLDQFDALPSTPHPDGRTDISVNSEEILYSKHEEMP